MKPRKRDNRDQTHITRSLTRYVVYDPEVSRRIHETAVQQIGIRNLTTEHLVAHGPTPVRKSPKTPNALFALYQEWRKATPWLGEILQAVWRPAVEDAWARHGLWTNTNREHVDAIVNAEKIGKSIPRRVQQRRPDPQRLFVSRKERDREHKHVVRIAEGLRMLDRKTLKVPEIGEIRLKEPLPEETDVRSVTLTERTAEAKSGRLKPEERTWVAHISHRIERPLEALTEGEQVHSTGVDHGVVHGLTSIDQNGKVKHLHYPEAKEASETNWRRLECLKARCKRGSRRWRKLNNQQAGHARHERCRRQETRRRWANEIAERADVVGIELLQIRNMMRSAKGTSEAPGNRVAQKRGLARRLAATAPGLQTTELIEACERRATRYRLTTAAYSSQRCAACGHTAKENRESQAGFRCVRCGRRTNADANAGENNRLTALAFYGVAVERSPGHDPEKSPSWGVAMTPEGSPRDQPQGAETAALPDAETPRPG